jgi:hypothetical protein
VANTFASQAARAYPNNPELAAAARTGPRDEGARPRTPSPDRSRGPPAPRRRQSPFETDGHASDTAVSLLEGRRGNDTLNGGPAPPNNQSLPG